MKIAKVTTYLVEGLTYNWTLVKVETEKGLYGWGEATNWHVLAPKPEMPR